MSFCKHYFCKILAATLIQKNVKRKASQSLTDRMPKRYADKIRLDLLAKCANYSVKEQDETIKHQVFYSKSQAIASIVTSREGMLQIQKWSTNGW